MALIVGRGGEGGVVICPEGDEGVTEDRIGLGSDRPLGVGDGMGRCAGVGSREARLFVCRARRTAA
jgi:hypothetical protein